MFAALLDTNVLWPSLHRDVLLSFAVEGIYRPLWSSAILDELAFHEARKLRQRGVGSGDAEARAARLIASMRAAFADSEVAGWQALEGTFGLPDVDDEHVIAAAVLGGAGVLVTTSETSGPRGYLQDLRSRFRRSSRTTPSPSSLRLRFVRCAPCRLAAASADRP